MGFLNLFKGKKSFDEKAYNKEKEKQISKFINQYNLNDIESILSIPVPENRNLQKNYIVPALPEQILSKKATEHKKNGNIDLAIACLRKANEFRNVSPCVYQFDDYYRLVEYLKQARMFDEARKEEHLLNCKTFSDTENSAQLFDNFLINLKRAKCDLFEINTYEKCPLCSMYDGRVYSVSGKSKVFPSINNLPNSLKLGICEECGSLFEFYPFYENSPDYHKKVELASKPVKDRRSKKVKLEYEETKKTVEQEEIDKLEYDYLWEHIPEICPKSYSGYRKMKKSNSANFQKLQAAALEKGFEIKFL